MKTSPSSLLHSPPISYSSLSIRQRTRTNNFFNNCTAKLPRLIHTPKSATLKVVSALNQEGYSDRGWGDHGEVGRGVDESMIVLRLRIQELQVAEGSNERDAPPYWMEWEKRYYVSGDYNRDVFEAVGWLQWWLMNTRPSLALVMAALVAISVPTSMALVLFHLFQISKWWLPRSCL